MHIYIHAHTHTHTHIHKQTQTHTHAHTDTHTHVGPHIYCFPTNIASWVAVKANQITAYRCINNDLVIATANVT